MSEIMDTVKPLTDTWLGKARKKHQEMRAQVLNEEVSVEREEKAKVKRIHMECLDFDWIFNTYVDEDGKQKCNTLSFMRLLEDNDHNSKLYKQNSIRVFLTMLWSKYYPMIIFYKLVPFCINLVAQNLVTLLGA